MGNQQDFSGVVIGGIRIPCTDDNAQQRINDLVDSLPSEINSANPLVTKAYVDSKFIDLQYAGVNYSVQTTQFAGGNLTIDGSKPVHIITLTGNVSSVVINPIPPLGHSTHVIFTGEDSYAVVIGHNAQERVCPQATDVELSFVAGGFAEANFLSDGTKVFVRGI